MAGYGYQTSFTSISQALVTPYSLLKPPETIKLFPILAAAKFERDNESGALSFEIHCLLFLSRVSC